MELVPRNLITVVLSDALLLLALYFVLLDLGRRVAYAASPHTACPSLCGYKPSFTYTFFTQFFTMSGNGVSLTSPPTLDWVQVITLIIIIVNGWFFYDLYRRRKADIKQSAPTISQPQTLP